jgi:hypothetical protein
MTWTGHAARMREKRDFYMVPEVKPEGKKLPANQDVDVNFGKTYSHKSDLLDQGSRGK